MAYFFAPLCILAIYEDIFVLTLYTPKAIIVPHQIIQSWYTGRWWMGCYIWYNEEWSGRAADPSSPLLAVLNLTAHPSTASVPITVLIYDGLLLCGFNVAIEGLNEQETNTGVVARCLYGRCQTLTTYTACCRQKLSRSMLRHMTSHLIWASPKVAVSFCWCR